MCVGGGGSLLHWVNLKAFSKTCVLCDKIHFSTHQKLHVIFYIAPVFSGYTVDTESEQENVRVHPSSS